MQVALVVSGCHRRSLDLWPPWDHPWTPDVLRPGHCGAEFIDPPCDVFKFIDTWHKFSDQWNCKNRGCLVVWCVYPIYIHYMHICINVLGDKHHMIVGEMMINTHNMGNSFRCIPVQLNAVKSGHVFIFRKDTLRSTHGLSMRGSNVYCTSHCYWVG